MSPSEHSDVRSKSVAETPVRIGVPSRWLLVAAEKVDCPRWPGSQSNPASASVLAGAEIVSDNEQVNATPDETRIALPSRGDTK